MSVRTFISIVAAAVSLATAGIASAQSGPAGGFISELKAGVLLHDVLRDNATKNGEENSIDLGGEVLLTPITLFKPDSALLKALLQPRPHLGGQINTDDNTNQLYFGLTWDYRAASGPFFEFGFGFTVHDGQLKGKTPSNDRPNLGSSVLFREGIDLGYRFAGGHSLAVHASHISNAGWFAKQNDGMNFVGLRYGFRFD